MKCPNKVILGVVIAGSIILAVVVGASNNEML
jgi:hypothetical protein